MRFHYVAAQNDGKTIEGETTASDAAEVLSYLVSRGLKPISLKKEKSFEVKNDWRYLFRSAITIEDKIFLTKYLALMLKTGSDLFRAIDILIADFDKPSMRSFLYEIRENLERGQAFYRIFARYPRYFSTVFVNLVKAGETTGTLDKTFEDLSKSLQKEDSLRREISSSLIYPIILVMLSLGIVFILVSFVLPKISDLFSSGNFNPPPFSRIVFGVGRFFNDYLLVFLTFFFVSGAGLFLAWRQSAVFRQIAHTLFFRVPLVGPVLRRISLQRFCSTLGALLASGIPLVDCLNITAQVVGDEEMKQALLRISQEGVLKGVVLGDAFKREAVFPRVLVNLIAISEKGGSLSAILITLSDFYEGEIKTSLKTMLTFLEPALLVFIGAIVALIAASILVPIYQLFGSFK